MNSIIYLIALATFISTLFGGFIILKFKNSLPYFFAFAAGSVIAVAFLDLLPESIEIANSSNIPLRTIMLIVVASFFLYSLIEKFFATHHLEDNGHGHVLGPIGAGSLVVHSFLDGSAIGIAFQVSASAGIIVALAVIMHDMTDGINTVAVMLKNKQSMKRTITFLAMDALAPVMGLIATSLILIPERTLAFILAFFAGEFIYIGASTLLPEAHHHPSRRIIIAMAIGILLIAFLTSLL